MLNKIIKTQRGFIQIPILVLIIVVAITFLGMAGYLGVKFYQIANKKKIESFKKNQIQKKENKRIQELILNQQEALEKTQEENERIQELILNQQEALEKTPEELEKVENEATRISEHVNSSAIPTNNSPENNLTDLIELWKPQVAKIICSFDGLGDISNYYGISDIKQAGSGYLIEIEFRSDKTGKVDERSYAIATNAHVVLTPPQSNISAYYSKGKYRDIFASSCEISFTDHPTIYKTVNVQNGELLTTPAGIGYIIHFQDYIGDPSGVDFALVKIKNPDMYIKQNVGSLSSCSEIKLGEKIATFGFPGIGSKRGITVTEGIISGEEENYYVTSAKIDSGNSGGIAISVDNNCFIGTLTATAVGEAESLGRILKTEYLLEKKGLIKTP